MGDFIVGFLDLVGSKDDLRRVDLAESEQDKAARLEIVVRRMLAFRDDFEKILSAASEIESEFDAACPESLRARRETHKGNAARKPRASTEILRKSRATRFGPIPKTTRCWTFSRLGWLWLWVKHRMKIAFARRVHL